MKNRPSPVRYGTGGGLPIDYQARNYTVDCLQKIKALLDAQKLPAGQSGDDARLQFAVAKYLIELGWGRNPLRALERESDQLMSPDEQAKLRRFIDEYSRAPKTYPAPVIDGTFSGSAGDSGVEADGATSATDTNG